MKFVIIGAGEVGFSLSQMLSGHEHDVTLIDQDEARLKRISSLVDFKTLRGDGVDPALLQEAEINSADYCIAVTNIDAVNIAVSLSARLLNPKAKRIARIREADFSICQNQNNSIEEYFDLIINPARITAEHVLQLLEVPGAKEVFDFAEGKLRVVGISITKDSPIADKRLQSLQSYQQEFPVLIIAIVRGEQLIIPRGTDRIRAGDILYSITIPGKTDRLIELADTSPHHAKSITIWGGSPLAKFIAEELQLSGKQVKLILSDPEEAKTIADLLPDILVLSGEGTDENLLIEEHINSTDVFIGATINEEDNILSALLAKQLGVQTSMSVVNKADYLTLVTKVGVDMVVSPRLTAASEIFQHIHSGSILSEFLIPHHEAGFIELIVDESMKVAGKDIAQLKLPNGALIAAIVRGEEVIIPHGKSSLQQGDRLVVFLSKSATKKLEKIFHLNLELFS